MGHLVVDERQCRLHFSEELLSILVGSFGVGRSWARILRCTVSSRGHSRILHGWAMAGHDILFSNMIEHCTYYVDNDRDLTYAW